MNEPVPTYPAVRFTRTTVAANVPLATGIYRMRLPVPDLARDIVPGQFIMLRAPGRTDPLLGRPFGLRDTVLDDAGRAQAVDIAYEVVGKLTGLMADWQPGHPVEVWGPLGNGFGPLGPDVDTVVLVSGGIGCSPFPALVRQWTGQRRYGDPPLASPDRTPPVELFYGARTATCFAGLEEFESVRASAHLATDDGTRGHHGLVTELADRWLDRHTTDRCHMVGCGPPGMLRATAELARRRGLTCQLSLEARMACGYGACFSCVTRVRTPDGTDDYRRVCIDGPVFDASDVVL